LVLTAETETCKDELSDRLEGRVEEALKKDSRGLEKHSNTSKRKNDQDLIN
jgi:hypothetical protein